MTVSDNYEPIRTVGNGSTTIVSFPWKIFDESEIIVSLIDTGATTNKALQTITTNYTVIINTTTDGGSITFLTAPPSTKDSILERAVANDQNTNIPDVGTITESQLEDAYDKGVIQVQQVSEILDRTLSISVDDNTLITGFSGEITGVTSNALLQFNADASGIQAATLASLSGIALPVTSGIGVFTGSNTFIAREIETTSSGILAITNPDGVAGNISLDPTPFVDDLAATTNGNGASKVGIEDAAGDITATTAEGAFAEIAANTIRKVQQISVTRAAATASSSQTVGHTLLKDPSIIGCVANNPTGTQTSSVGQCLTDGTNFAQACQSDDDSGAGGQHIQKDFLAQLMTSTEANGQRLAVSAVNTSSITLAWTKVGTPVAGTYEFELTVGA